MRTVEHGCAKLSIKVFIGPAQWGAATSNEDRIYIETPFQLKEACKSLPGARWSPAARAWHIPATIAAAQAFIDTFSGQQIEMTRDVIALLESARRAADAQSIKSANNLPDIPTRTTAWAHQRRAFHFAKHLDAAMLAMAMGSGKTLTAIGLLQEWDAKNVLIICPVSVMGVWPGEFAKHSVDIEEWHIVAGDPRMPVSARVESIAKGIVHAQKHDKRSVSIVNYESAWRDNMALLLKTHSWDCVIADESHRIKSAAGKASRFASLIGKQAKHRVALTGTPMPHSPLDIYAQYRFLDPGIFGTSKNRFMNRYAVMGGYENRQVKEWQNIDDLQKKFASIAYIVSKEEALPDLPDRLWMERTFQLSEKGLRAYKMMEKDFIVAVDEGVIVANNAMAKSLRLRQITSGHSRTEDGRTVIIDDGREKLLEDVLTELPDDEPVVVFSVFHPDLDAIARVTERLGRRYGELSGRRRDGLTDSSKMNPAIDVLGCQIKSGSLGVDFTRAAYAIYYNAGWELGDYEQSLDRIHRPGQTRTTRYIQLIAEDTIDRVVYKALRDKKSVVDAVLDAVRSHQA